MSATQWEEVLPGEPPGSLTHLPCDCWFPKEDGHGGWGLLCFVDGWYRVIPEEDLEKARELRAAVDATYEEEE